MAETWVVNASPIIVLAKVGKLDLFDQLGGEVLVPDPVALELLAGPADDSARAAIQRGWGTRVQSETIPTAVVEWGLGTGESAVIAIAHQRPGAIAVIDDAEARACARAMNVRLTGTLGVIARAFKAGLIPSLAETIAEVREAGLFVDDQLAAAVLRWGQDPHS